MAKQPNQLPRELKQPEAKQIDPFLLYIRELRGSSVIKESNLPPIKHPPGPNHKWSITNSPTTTNNSLPPPICKNTLKANSMTLAHSNSELDTDQGDMIDKTIKQVMFILHHTILTSDIGTFYPDKPTSAPPQQTNYNTNCNHQSQIGQNYNLRNSPKHQVYNQQAETNIITQCSKMNWLPEVDTTSTLTSFEKTKQIIMDMVHCPIQIHYVTKY